jgi:hypothetical protein
VLTRCDGVHSRESRNSGRASDDEHQRYQDVSHQAKDHKDDVSNGAIASPHDFEKGMRVGGASLELNGERGEE